jgi:5S rRNA maturation endonuclease (ribonuclease M5)
MDWDRTGGRLQMELKRKLESMDVKISEELRNVLMRALKPETRVLESLKGMAYDLGHFIDEYDERPIE